jgi:hemimethylated DNA binding protein
MSDYKRRTPNFRVGQIVHHKRFGYRGVIVDAHTDYEEASNASGRSSPSPADRRRPWYEILVHNPYVPVFFNEFEDGTYRVGGIDN